MAHVDPHAHDPSRHMVRYEREAAGRPASESKRRPREQRRIEIVALLLLVAAASIFSVAAPLGNVSAAPAPTLTPDPIADYTDEPIVDPTDEPSFDATETEQPSIDPNATFTPWPSLPPTRQPTPVVPRTAKPATVMTYVALGDSLTAWPSSNPWPSRLDAGDSHLRLIHNAGVPGNTTAQMRSRLNRDVFDYKPGVLFLLGGTNDLGLGYSYSTIISNLRAIIVAAKAHKIQVIVLLVPPDSYSSMAPKIDALNNQIMSLSRSLRVTYVDIHNPLSYSNGTIQSRYTSDGLHFSSLGAQAVANVIKNRVRLLGL
jgi:lysophospholipase L1-like esterase